MRIVRAQIDGFGRYSGVTFEFDEGMNIVYGQNEAGKSTLQQFLLAMLYGMKKPGRKRAVYLDEEAKYRPWQGSAYGGILWVEQDGVPYRIERSLRREDEWVRVYRQDTGEEVTKRFAVDANKEVAFAKELIGADREMFVNALCVGPVEERERASWLRDSARHSQGGSGQELIVPEQSRIREAGEAIGKRLEAIGTERATSKPFGLALKGREELRKAYQEALERERAQRDARQTAEEAGAKWQAAVAEEASLREAFAEKLSGYLSLQAARRGQIARRLAQLATALTDGAEHQATEATDELYRDVQQDFLRLMSVKQECDSYHKRLQLLREESESAISYTAQHAGMEEGKLARMEQTANRLEWYEQQTEQAAPAVDESDLQSVRAQLATAKRNLLLSIIATPLTLLLSFWSFYLSGLSLIPLALAAMSYRAVQLRKAEIADWERAVGQEERERAALVAEQERLEAELQQLLAEFGVDTPRQYRQKWGLLANARQQASLYQKQFQWLEGESSRASSERDRVARRLLRLIGRDEDLTLALDPDAVRREMEAWEADFQASRRRQEQASVWEGERAALNLELQALEKSMQRYQELAAGLDLPPASSAPLGSGEVTEAEVESGYESWRSAEREALQQNASFTAADTRYQTLQEGVDASADLLLELERANGEVAQIGEERAALLLAQEIWEEVKEELYQEIAPRFADSLSEVTERITAGRYRQVYLDREEAITTTSPDTGYTVELSSLSSGTMDQITFALGLSLSGWMIPGGEKLPLLLDEPFRRYDDGRLGEVCDVLLHGAASRQIFLFTCREQEVSRFSERGAGTARIVDLSQEKYGMIKADILRAEQR